MIQKNISLKKYNTFGINVKAKRFISITSVLELKELLKIEKELFILSGGSNILLISDVQKLTVHLNIKGIDIEKENKNDIFLKIGAGENWHKFVLWCISRNYGGIENLSLIPGNVGTSPIQNIGAYGVEVKDLIEKIEAIEINSGKLFIFSNEQCEFGYRNSIFKNKLKGKFIIISVTYKLTKRNHKINISYSGIKNNLLKKNIIKPTIKDVSDSVIIIRKNKLPNYNKIGNCGSFFKNPIISINLFIELQKKYSKIPFYKVSKNKIKIPAGWLIEKNGFKGKRYGDCGVHNKQALILVNYNNATGKNIYDLAKVIQKSVQEKFSILLEFEVNVI